MVIVNTIQSKYNKQQTNIHKDRKTKAVEEIASEIHSADSLLMLGQYGGISRIHAKLVRVNGVDYLVDMRSSHGTTIQPNSGRTITVGEERVRLSTLDEIRLCDYPIAYFGLDEDSAEFKGFAEYNPIKAMFRVGEQGD